MTDVDVGLDQAGEHDQRDHRQGDGREAGERPGEQAAAVGGAGGGTGRGGQDEEQRAEAAEPDRHRADVDRVDGEVEGDRGLARSVAGEGRAEDQVDQRDCDRDGCEEGSQGTPSLTNSGEVRPGVPWLPLRCRAGVPDRGGFRERSERGDQDPGEEGEAPDGAEAGFEGLFDDRLGERGEAGDAGGLGALEDDLGGGGEQADRGGEPEDGAQAAAEGAGRVAARVLPHPGRGAQRGQPAEEEEGDAADGEGDRHVLEPARQAVGDLGHLAVAGAADQFADRLGRRRPRLADREDVAAGDDVAVGGDHPVGGGIAAVGQARLQVDAELRTFAVGVEGVALVDPFAPRRRRRGPRRSSPRPARRIRRPPRPAPASPPPPAAGWSLPGARAPTPRPARAKQRRQASPAPPIKGSPRHLPGLSHRLIRAAVARRRNPSRRRRRRGPAAGAATAPGAPPPRTITIAAITNGSFEVPALPTHQSVPLMVGLLAVHRQRDFVVEDLGFLALVRYLRRQLVGDHPVHPVVVPDERARSRRPSSIPAAPSGRRSSARSRRSRSGCR